MLIFFFNIACMFTLVDVLVWLIEYAAACSFAYDNKPRKTGHLSEVNAIITVIALGSGERLAVTIQRRLGQGSRANTAIFRS